MLNNVEKCHWTIQHVSLGHIDFNIVFYIIYSICQQILAHFLLHDLNFKISDLQMQAVQEETDSD